MLNRIMKKPIMYYLASFVLPLLVVVITLIGLQITPFGDHTLLISDAKGYYINTLSYASRMYRGLEGLTYSFEKGLGGNMAGHLNGILLTPFAFLLSFANIANYPTVFAFISTLNLSLCGLTMFIFLADSHGPQRSLLIFSTTYALMGFNVANVFQAVFFCAAPVLPIMALGLKKLFHGGNPLLYVLSIAFGLLTNAYFGYVLCAASVLFFLVGLYYYREALKGRMLRILLRFAVSSMCGGLLVAMLWLPGFLSLRGGRLEQDASYAISFWENMPFFEIGAKLFTGANTTDELVNGMPNIYIGIIPLALSVYFFLNHEIIRRKKVAAGMLLIIYLLAFYTSMVNLVMHAGATTNWFNYRYSYVFSFLLLVAAAESWQQFDGLTEKDIKRGFIGMLIATALIFSRKYSFVKGGWMLLDYALLLLAGLALFMFRRDPAKNPRKTLELILLFLVCINLSLNYRVCTLNIRDWEVTASDFQKNVQAVEPLVRGVKSADSDFYRMEVNQQLTMNCGNDPMLYGYNGVGHGGSNERDFVRMEPNKLGIPWYSNRSYYSDGVPAATDALVGIRYLVSTVDVTQEKGYIRMTDMEKARLAGDGESYDLYKCDYALPIALLSRNALDGIVLTYDNVFDNLNKVWSAISDSERLAFIEENDIAFQTINHAGPAKISANEAREITQSYERKNESSETSDTDNSSASDSTDGDLVVHLIQDEAPMFSSSIEFSWTAKQDGPVYVYHRAAMSPDLGARESVIKYMGWYRAGETVRGYLPVSGDAVNRVTLEEYAGRFRAAYADLDALRDMSEAVRKQPSEVTKEQGHDEHLTGSFIASKDETMLFTIPWDEGWTCWIDGERVKLEETLGVFMSTKVELGEHTFEMKYVPAGLNAGIRISACTLVFTLLYLLFGKKWMDRLWAHRDAAREAVLAAQKEATADDSI